MGFPTKVQLIKRVKSEQWYINFPSAVAQAMEFVRGEVVEWIIEDKGRLVLRRREVPPSAVKKLSRTDGAFRSALEEGGLRIFSGAHLEARTNIGREFTYLSGKAYYYWNALIGRQAVCRLDGGLSAVCERAH